MASESLRTATPADNDTSPRRSPSPASLQLLPSGQEMSEILQQMCGEISQTTTAEMVEVANTAASKLQDLMPVYFYSWELQSPEAVIIYLLLRQWRDSSERRRERRAFKEHSERLKARMAELEKKLYSRRYEVNRGESEPEINRLMKQVQELQLQNEKLQSAHNELCHTSSQWALNCESLVQRISALEQHVEELNGCMRSLEEENHQLLNIFSRQQPTSTDEGTQHDSPLPATPPHPQTVENCCASSVFVHGRLLYECSSLSACPLHQDVSPHTYNWYCVVSGRTIK